MGIKRIKIRNVLSFDNLVIDKIDTINCSLGKNNAGKSNLFKLINFYYRALEGERILAPELNSNYDSNGYIEITFDTSHINKLVHSERNRENNYFGKVRRTLFNRKINIFPINFGFGLNETEKKVFNEFSLNLVIKNDGTYYFKDNDRNVHKTILDIFPIFEIDSRHLDLHNWDKLWSFLGKLRPFNAVDFQKEFNEMLHDNPNLSTYRDNINQVNELSNTVNYTYRDKIVNYLKAGLKGDKFEFEGFELSRTSDGTNSYQHILTVCRLVAYLSRRTYQTPVIYIDEPELGLHPKMNERFIHELSEILKSCYIKKDGSPLSSPPPKFFFSTHSPNIVKQVIKTFQNKHRIFHFTKNASGNTIISSANSNFSDNNFLCNFSDNEARLFFSSFILFVEGQTEKELFENDALTIKFPHLIDVDIYKSSDEKVSKKITPDFVNTAVSYRFLFDADKVIRFSKGRDKKYRIHLEKYGSTINLTSRFLNEQNKKNRLGFCAKNRKNYETTNKIISYDNSEVKISEFHQTVIKPKTLAPFYRDINNLLTKQKCIIVSTTIEGSLINSESINIFYSWLKASKSVNIDAVLTRVERCRYLTKEDLVQYFRIIFNGKSDSLVNYKNFKKGNLTSNHALKIMSWLETSTISNSQLSKTDGWVTSFLTYAIDYIEKESKEKNLPFNKLFSNYFKELYGIISELRYGS